MILPSPTPRTSRVDDQADIHPERDEGVTTEDHDQQVSFELAEKNKLLFGVI